MSAPFLLLNQSQVFVGLGTLSYTVTVAGTYNVIGQVLVPEAVATGDGAGSNTGLGSGAGGGDVTGFARGGNGLSDGGVGQGFGAVPNNYQQPPAYGSNETQGPAVTSGLSVVVNKNGTPIYTMPTLAVAQSASQLKFAFQAAINDAITVVISSSTASDETLNGVKSIIAIQQGQ